MIVDNGYERPCYRALDLPLRILGLEVSDWFVLVVFFVACLFGTVLLGLSLLLALPFVLWAALIKARKGRKQPAYLRYLFYRSGAVFVLRLLIPELVPAPYLVPPMWVASKGRPMFLSANRQEGEGWAQGNFFMKFFLYGRRWVGHDPKASGKLAGLLSRIRGEKEESHVAS